MMTTSSAEPARLEGYPDALAGADEELAALATRTDAAIAAFVRGADAYVPAGFDPDWARETLRGFHDESRYLAAWVARIGAGFRAADTDANGDGIFTADDGFLDDLVGPATTEIPPAGTDPAEVAAWWALLPLDVRERMIEEDYAQLGMLRGLPAEDTDLINRNRLEHDRAALDARYDEVADRIAEIDEELDGGVSDIDLLAERDRLREEQIGLEVERDNARKIADQMRLLDEQHREDPTGQPRPYLLTYAYQNEGRFAVALGNPDHADNTAVVVPGTGHDVKHEGGPLPTVGEGERLYHEMYAQSGPNGGHPTTAGPHATRNAVIVWMGTDMPDDFGAAMNGTYGDSEHGAAWLRDDVAGYQASHAQAQSADTHMTVVAHSYGSYMTGEAIKAGMDVDDFVSVGSPGIDADNAGALDMANEHVWAGAVQGWPDLLGGDGDVISDSGWHGTRPTDPDFGATVFDTEDSVSHSEYYKDDSQSLKNIARISVGHYSEVERRPPDNY